MERESFKEYSEVAMVEKKEFKGMKSCFKNLMDFFS